MNYKEEFLNLAKEAINDFILVKAEKRTLKNFIQTHQPSKREADVLRSEVFKMAEAKINKDNYFQIIQWIEEMNKAILSAEKDDESNERVYFSPGEECLNAILSQIKGSTQKINICLFTISDDRISNTLMDKHKLGIPVKVITDNDKIYDKGSDIAKLVDAGISVKVDITDKHMHHKFALFDNKTTLTGSYNWTRSAERYNHENILITQSEGVYRSFDREFKKLWSELMDYHEI